MRLATDEQEALVVEEEAMEAALATHDVTDELLSASGAVAEIDVSNTEEVEEAE